MKLIKTIQGLFRRFTRLKRDKDYKPNATSFGEIEVDFMSSVLFTREDGTEDNNVILHVSVMERSDDAIMEFKALLRCIHKFGFRTHSWNVEKCHHILIAGSSKVYAAMYMFYMNDVDMGQNKIFLKMYRLLTMVDVASQDIIDAHNNCLPEDDYNEWKYDGKAIGFLSQELTHMQTVFDYRLDDIGIDSMYTILPLLMASLKWHDPLSGKNYIYIIDYVPEFLNIINNDEAIRSDVKMRVDEWEKYEYAPGKNIFNINFQVSQIDESVYEDIDEILN